MLKGIAIIGVLLDNWTGFMAFTNTPAILNRFAHAVATAVGPWVQVFFVLSGFGLTWGYLGHIEASWRWRRWTWRRLTKIVLPYFAAVLFSFFIGWVVSGIYGTPRLNFSWSQLLAYLTFSRNFFPSTWAWNPPMWFMAVIIGLYVSFPVLILVLRNWGAWALLLVSTLVSYGTLAAWVLGGGSQSHAADHFTFWMLPFSLGMVLAYIRASSPRDMRHLIGPGAFVVGSALLVTSWWLRTYVPLGAAFNDSLTSFGIFLVLLNVVWAVRAWMPGAATALGALGNASYYMFLIHYPLMRLVIPPALRGPLNPIAVLALGGVFIALSYFTSYFLAQPVDRLAARVYRRCSI